MADTSDIVASLNNDIEFWVSRTAAKNGWTFERVLDWKTRNILKNATYQKLPRWAKEKIDTAFNIYYNILESTLIWTHVLDGKRIIYSDPAADNRAKDIHDQNVELSKQGKANSAFCHAFALPDSRLILVPFRDEDRKLEIESGRLTEEDIGLITNHKTVHLPRGNVMNGTAILTCRVSVNFKDGKVILPESQRLS